MKSYIKSALPALAAVAMLCGCSENSWNDKLDGFEVPEVGTATSTLTYTLTPADYKKIATQKIYKDYAAAHEQSDILAVIEKGAFPSEELAVPYIAMFLRDSTNNFYALANGSAIKVTYDIAQEKPAVLAAIEAAERYTVTEADYITAWGSDDDYIDAYAPSVPAARSIPGILKAQFPDAEAGQYAVVTYNQASQDPIFATVGGGEEKPAYEPTAVLGDCEVGDFLEVKGFVTAICTRGFILTDDAGSILCYQGSSFDASVVSIGDFVSIDQEVSSYGKGLQLAISDGSYTIEGSSKYTYPTPITFTGEMMDAAVARTNDEGAAYITFVGKASVGNFINFAVEGAETAQGSAYYITEELKAQLTDGETYQITGYFSSISSGRYFNVIITSIGKPAAKAPASRSAVAAVPSEAVNAMYTFNGTAWSAVTDVTVLQPADYLAMGQKYGNLSNNLPAQLLPIYCKNAFPYAVADDEVTIAYLYYGSGNTAYRAAQLVFDGTDWTMDEYKTPVTAQYVRNKGFWNYDPSVVLTLPYARNTDPSYTYYMACVNWVFEHVGKEMGGTSLTSSPFIDYRGNAEFYSGASAYYGNIDVRATTALNNAPEGYTAYEGLSDEEITLLIEKRFCLETLPGALAMLHPDANTVAGIDEVTYTINFTAYETGGVAAERQVIYVVTGPAQFTYKSCTWFENGEDAGWSPLVAE